MWILPPSQCILLKRVISISSCFLSMLFGDLNLLTEKNVHDMIWYERWTTCFNKSQLKIKITFFLSLGCMMSCAWKDDRCRIGMILGTGTNACYLEQIKDIHTIDKDKFADQVNLLLDSIFNIFSCALGSSFNRLIPLAISSRALVSGTEKTWSQ